MAQFNPLSFIIDGTASLIFSPTRTYADDEFEWSSMSYEDLMKAQEGIEIQADTLDVARRNREACDA